jgi:hypothetical protein
LQYSHGDTKPAYFIVAEWLMKIVTPGYLVLQVCYNVTAPSYSHGHTKLAYFIVAEKLMEIVQFLPDHLQL